MTAIPNLSSLQKSSFASLSLLELKLRIFDNVRISQSCSINKFADLQQ